MSKFGPSFKGDAPKILKELKDIEGEDVKEAIESEGVFKIEIEGKIFELTPEHVNFEDIEESVRGRKDISSCHRTIIRY